MSSHERTLAPRVESDPGDEASHTSDPSHIRPRKRLPARPKRDALTRVRHDLRSLTHSVIGYSDLLASPEHGVLSCEQQRFLEHVRAAAAQLEELVDTYVELAHPASAADTLELPIVQLGAALAHVCAGLVLEGASCTLEVSPTVAARELVLDLPALTRGLRALARVIGQGTSPLSLRARPVGGRTVISLSASEEPGALADLQVDALETELGNREFVRLKLAETVLARQDVMLRVRADLSGAELDLT